jgi:Hemocyanin, all-alpha domain
MAANNLLLLFERPREPLVVPKGRDNVLFEVPRSFLTERFQSMAPLIEKKFANEIRSRVPVQDTHVPDLAAVSAFPRTDNFTLLQKNHREIASQMVEIFMSARDVEELLSYACFARDRINSQLFFYALSVAILHRSDTKNMNIPHFAEIFPCKFANSDTLSIAMRNIFSAPEDMRRPYVIPRPSVLENDIESR